MVDGPSRLLGDLDDEQRAAVLVPRGPVCIIAGAGTGKTRTVTYRLAHASVTGAVNPAAALAVTHSRKAAAELTERLAALGAGTVESRTFHSAALRVATRFWASTGLPGARPVVLDDRRGWLLWRDALRQTGSKDPTTTAVRDLIDEVSWARSRLVSAEEYPTAALLADRHPGISHAAVVQAWEWFTKAKAREERLDFQDLLEAAWTVLDTDPAAAAMVRQRWAHITVDEYQDTDPAQQRFLDAIVGDGNDVCVVGDPRQAIYSWKGADVTYLHTFAQSHPGTTTIELTRNYRSSPEVLRWANRLASRGKTRPLTSTRDTGPSPTITELPDDNAEAGWVVSAIQRALSAGTAVSEIAVLYRFNAAQARFEAACTRAQIPTVVADDTTFFEREEIQSVLKRFGQMARLDPQRPGLDLLCALLAEGGFDRDKPPEGQGAARTRWESLQALLDLVDSSPTLKSADSASLLAEFNQLASRTHGPRVAGVTLATLHRAKGLEWDVVFVVGVHDGSIPAGQAKTPEARAEEERLLHVGVTRARRELHLTWAAANPRGWDNRPSPYFDLLAPEPAPRKKEGRRSPEPRSPVAAARISGQECPHCSDPLKGVAARHLGVCGNCVLSVPGPTGQRARALDAVLCDAERRLGIPKERLVSPAAFLRLLDQRPQTEEGIAAIAGVGHAGEWAEHGIKAISI